MSALGNGLGSQEWTTTLSLLRLSMLCILEESWPRGTASHIQLSEGHVSILFISTIMNMGSGNNLPSLKHHLPLPCCVTLNGLFNFAQPQLLEQQCAD